MYLDNGLGNINGLGRRSFKRIIKSAVKAPFKLVTAPVKTVKKAAKSKTLRKVAKVAAGGALLYYTGGAALKYMKKRGKAPDGQIIEQAAALVPEGTTPQTEPAPGYSPPVAPGYVPQATTGYAQTPTQYAIPAQYEEQGKPVAESKTNWLPFVAIPAAILAVMALK